MKKRLICMLLVVCIVLLVAPETYARNSAIIESIEDCDHSYEAVVTEPTCTEVGYTTYTCSKCKESYIDGEVSALGHDYVNGECTRCGEKDPDYVAGSPVITVGDVYAIPGETITVPVSIHGNPGFAGFTLAITADASLTLKEISEASLLSASESGALTSNLTKGLVNWTDCRNEVGDGELLLLTYEVKESAKDGDYAIQIKLKDGKASNFVNESCQATSTQFESGTVTVKAVIPGDINGDGDISSADSVLLARYLVGMEELAPAQRKAADVTYDGEVTTADAVKLAEYLVGLISWLDDAPIIIDSPVISNEDEEEM